MSADKLASFRVDSQLWEQFQSHAKENNTNASALLVAYIKSVVNTGNVITSNPVINTSSEAANPSLSIQDIDKRMDDKIKTALQNINTPSIQNIEDLIDSRVGGSIASGDIRAAISSSYAAMMGQFNGLLEELQELKKQMEELQSIPHHQSPITNPQSPPGEDVEAGENLTAGDIECDRQTADPSPITNDQIIELFGLEEIIKGKIYTLQSLKDEGILERVEQHQEILSRLGVEFKSSTVKPVNETLKKLGYKTSRKTNGRDYYVGS